MLNRFKGCVFLSTGSGISQNTPAVFDPPRQSSSKYQITHCDQTSPATLLLYENLKLIHP